MAHLLHRHAHDWAHRRRQGWVDPHSFDWINLAAFVAVAWVACAVAVAIYDIGRVVSAW